MSQTRTPAIEAWEIRTSEEAASYAAAAFRIGRTEPEILDLLAAKGLTIEQARLAVHTACENLTKAANAALARADETRWPHRWASLACFVVLTTLLPPPFDGGRPRFYFAFMSLALLCIWFPEAMLRRSDETALRASFVRWIAWFLLLSIAGVVWW
ncbi:MAG: hypothetical protein QM811_27850 [Pirellulales bacterium]